MKALEWLNELPPCTPNMNIEIDLLKLCGVVGIEAIQKMFDAHMINREQLDYIAFTYNHPKSTEV